MLLGFLPLKLNKLKSQAKGDALLAVVLGGVGRVLDGLACEQIVRTHVVRPITEELTERGGVNPAARGLLDPVPF